MKKYMAIGIILVALLTTGALSGCSKQPAPAVVEKQTEQSQQETETSGESKQSAVEGIKDDSNSMDESAGGYDNNPIDQAFKKDFEQAMSTVEINMVADKYYEAWEAELSNITDEIEKQYTFDADRKVVQDYKKSLQVYAKKAADLEFLEWTDTTVEPGDKRVSGTGGAGAAISAQTEVYKRGVAALIRRYYMDKEYTYQYKGNGADLETLQKNNE